MFLSSVGACHIDGIDKSRLSPPPYLSLSLHTLLHSVYYFCTATPPLLLPLLLTTPLLPPLLSIALHFHTIFCLFILVLARKKFDFFFDIFGCSYTCFRIFSFWVSFSTRRFWSLPTYHFHHHTSKERHARSKSFRSFVLV